MSTSRVKDAGFLQQHIEKLILAGGGLVLLIAVVLFVMGNPFSVEVDGQTFASPDEAVEVLRNGSENLRRGLQSSQPLPATTPPNFDEHYIASMKQPVNSEGAVASLSKTGLTGKALNPPKVEPPRYAMVYPPMPKQVEYSFGTDVLDTEFNPAIVNTYFELWGERRQPADFSMFIAAGEFDIWEWSKRLSGTSDASSTDGNKIPLGIWAKRFGVAGVALLREEWDEDSGVWTNRQYVKPLPGQIRFLPTDAAPTDPSAAITRIEQLLEAQEDIAHPELPWLIDFVQAVPPGGLSLRDGAEGYDEFGREKGEEILGPAEQRIKDMEDKIKALEERRRARDDRDRGREDRPRPGRGGGDEFGRPDRPDRADRPTRERSDPIQRQIDELRERIERLRPRASAERTERLRLLEIRKAQDEERRRREQLAAEREAAGLGREPGFEIATKGIELKEGASVRVWAADPTMMPGKTYRYKLVVASINPLYGVPRLESEQLAENIARAAILPTDSEIESAEWIGPVTVEPRARFFFTSGGENRAKVEIFRRHSGTLTKAGFDLTPGDPIGGEVTIKDKDDIRPPVDVNMGIGAVLIDIERRRTLAGDTDYTLIFMDKNGTLHERSLSQDANNPEHKELTREVKEGPNWELRPDEEDLDRDRGFDEFDDFGGGGFDDF